jgi:hypothetical protein
MKTWLMHENRDFDPRAPLPSNAADLVQDLGMDLLFDAMAAGDPFLEEVGRPGVLCGLRDSAAILYRQQVLSDALAHPEVVRQLYSLSVEAVEREKRVWGWMTTKYPNELLHRSVEVLEIFAGVLISLRQIADEQESQFQSKGFLRFFAMLRSELDDEYLGRVRDHLERLAFHSGILMSAELGPGNKGTNYILRRPPEVREGWLARLQNWVGWFRRDSDALTYEIAERDEAGFNALGELKSEGIASVAAALAHSTDHILDFLKMLRRELGFYVGCLNLRDQLAARGEGVCIPKVADSDENSLSAFGLYDPSLALSMESRMVPNDLAADGKQLIVMTGANRGGKSTLLRGLGLAQIMMQCGMYVAADSFHASLCEAIFTHFKREEDASMKSGKLDEELARMSAIVDHLAPKSLVLLNESFASTNEREGSEISRQIVRALLEMGIRVFYVTHMFDLAASLHDEQLPNAVFLRAERLPNGERTFRVVEGAPLPTSHVQDLYRTVFGDATDSNKPAARPSAAGNTGDSDLSLQSV